MAVFATLNIGAVINRVVALTNLPGNTAIDLSLKTAITLDANTTPAVDEAWARRLSLSAGTLTLALDALPQTELTTLDLTGEVVYAVVIYVPATSAAVTVAGAGSNAYELFGTDTEQVVIDPGGWLIHYSPTGFGTVSGTVSDITFSGTDTDSFDIAIIAGTP
jgi:hypothetical protein